jgi:hypothetical protein
MIITLIKASAELVLNEVMAISSSGDGHYSGSGIRKIHG